MTAAGARGVPAGITAPGRLAAGPLRIALLFALGMFCLQAAWSVAVPPFHGIDEFDHSYRASAVANGQWRADPAEATRGTGAVLTVSPDIVEGAGPFCRQLLYTTEADCSAQGQTNDGLALVASGAGRYNPVYYALVGWPDRLLDGGASLVGMRLAGSALASGLVGLAAYALARSGLGRLPMLGLVLALTPVAVYSGAVVAPNGLEIVAGVLLWCALLAMTRGTNLDSTSRRRLVWLAALASVLLVTLRSLGPLWLALVLLTAVPLVWPLDVRRSLAWAREQAAALVTVAIAGLVSLAWILGNRSLEIGYEAGRVPDPVAETLRSLPLWLFQSIAAFPFRNHPAPAGVYALVLLTGAVFVGLALRRGPRRLVLSMLLVLTAGAAVPVLITLATIQDFGVAWQGRYGLPLSVGLPLLAGFALADSEGRSRRTRHLVSAAVALVGAAHVWSVLFVHRSERGGDLVWSSAALAAVLATAGVAAWAVAVRRTERAVSEPAPAHSVAAEGVVV